GFRLYDLRHTALSRMAMSGIDLATLKELAGHFQIQVTMRYVHPTPEHKRMAIERFENCTKQTCC
ncbi:MAG: tyrosine-type recombinase/integrase, partial [Acidobacteria bacterium]|nr:tyrosine-type recombinase/integrase [Acidobacteriota bacterium]